jgi:hypothetical protein
MTDITGGPLVIPLSEHAARIFADYETAEQQAKQLAEQIPIQRLAAVRMVIATAEYDERALASMDIRIDAAARTVTLTPRE